MQVSGRIFCFDLIINLIKIRFRTLRGISARVIQKTTPEKLHPEKMALSISSTTSGRDFSRLTVMKFSGA